jgi:hypothetical protein
VGVSWGLTRFLNAPGRKRFRPLPTQAEPPDWLSASRINPSPVTTGPFSVIATQRSATNLANMIAGTFREDAPGATSSSAASSSGVRSAGLSH